MDEIAAVELGLRDDIHEADAVELVAEAARLEKPLLARLPFYESYQLALPIADAGADALVLTAPPRGTARDRHTGRLVSGRLYGPLIKPLNLRLVGRLRRQLPDELPIIASGGVHSPQDARDYIEAGAIAVQVDAATWAQPKMLERIARDLGGWIATRQRDALPDEWNPDMSHTEAIQRRAAHAGSRGAIQTRSRDNSQACLSTIFVAMPARIASHSASRPTPPTMRRRCAAPNATAGELTRLISQVAIPKSGRDYRNMSSREMLSVLESGETGQVDEMFRQVGGDSGLALRTRGAPSMDSADTV